MLDENRQPLCLLPQEEILRQKLFHLRIAILITDKRDKWLLSVNSNGIYDFSFCGIVPAHYGAGEYAAFITMERWKLNTLRPLLAYAPCPENMRAFTYIYKAVLSTSMAEMFAREREKYILADTVEIKSLMNYGSDFSPLLKLYFGDFETGIKR